MVAEAAARRGLAWSDQRSTRLDPPQGRLSFELVRTQRGTDAGGRWADIAARHGLIWLLPSPITGRSRLRLKKMKRGDGE